ncbi:hypothetical protein THIOM_001550 [Candidatus Thiomargarita nelsonii]|uniref:Protein containing DUF1814 n=1 Tax=Candidatus Thiomargarita nelsonii TaxID=1003181 RepID=A0A176S400_9GAMM|nr:hypothetical protein THIOM_001550 [Candidatus Thiomargarita nelsonii]
MSKPKQADISALIESLISSGVEFIVVGGAAAVLHGAPTATVDLDIVHRQTSDNVNRLMNVLTSLDTIYRDPAGRHIVPTKDDLMGKGQLNLSTDLGPLDPLCRLHDGRGFDELIPHSVVLSDSGKSIRVLDLDTLIEIKDSTKRPRDKLVVSLLVALRERDL